MDKRTHAPATENISSELEELLQENELKTCKFPDCPRILRRNSPLCWEHEREVKRLASSKARRERAQEKMEIRNMLFLKKEFEEEQKHKKFIGKALKLCMKLSKTLPMETSKMIEGVPMFLNSSPRFCVAPPLCISAPPTSAPAISRQEDMDVVNDLESYQRPCIIQPSIQ